MSGCNAGKPVLGESFEKEDCADRAIREANPTYANRVGVASCAARARFTEALGAAVAPTTATLRRSAGPAQPRGKDRERRLLQDSPRPPKKIGDRSRDHKMKKRWRFYGLDIRRELAL